MITELLEEMDRSRNQDLLKYIESFDGYVEVKPPMQEGDRISPSGIEDFCPRFEAMRHKLGLEVHDKIDPKLGRIFRAGRVFERGLRDSILGSLAGKGILLGKWRCVCCGYVPESVNGSSRYKKPEVACSSCSSESWTYHEEEKTDSGSWIGGSTDGFIFWANDIHIIEIKTINDFGYKNVIRSAEPLPRHYSQAQMYMWLHGLKSACIWYYNKNTSAQTIFWVKYDAAKIAELTSKADSFRDYFKTGEVPKRSVCPDRHCSRAKNCGLVQQCFSEEKF